MLLVALGGAMAAIRINDYYSYVQSEVTVISTTQIAIIISNSYHFKTIKNILALSVVQGFMCVNYLSYSIRLEIGFCIELYCCSKLAINHLSLWYHISVAPSNFEYC